MWVWGEVSSLPMTLEGVSRRERLGEGEGAVRTVRYDLSSVLFYALE